MGGEKPKIEDVDIASKGPPPKMDREAQREAFSRHVHNHPGKVVTALPHGSKNILPSGFRKLPGTTTVVKNGKKHVFDVYVGPADGSDQAQPDVDNQPKPPGADAVKDIEGNFSDAGSPDGVCVKCIARGFARGVVIGYVIGTILGMLSGAWLVAAAAILIAVAVKGIIDLAKNWSNMTSHQKQEAVAEIVGGLMGGGRGVRRGGKIRKGIARRRALKARRQELSKDPQTGKVNQKSAEEADAILKAEEKGIVKDARRPKLDEGEPNLDFIDKNGYADVKTPKPNPHRTLSQQASDVARKSTHYDKNVKVVVNLKHLSPAQRTQFKADLVSKGADISKIHYVND